MARVSTGVLRIDTFLGHPQLGLYLDRYQEVLGIPICAFNGVNKPDENNTQACSSIVTQTERDDLAKYLLQAEQRREEQLRYHLGEKWDVNEHHDSGMNNPYALKWKWLREVGYPTYVDIELDAAIDYGTPPFTTANPPTDPVEVTVTTAVDVSEIIVRYPGETVHIHPTSITDNGDGTVTILIPRCRLVKPEYNDDRMDPIGYYDEDPFLETVDVVREYADVFTGAQFVWRRPNCVTNCTPVCQSACPIISSEYGYELSIVHVYPATHSGGAWTQYNCWSYATKPDTVKFSYRSGKYSMNDELLTIRLAHTLMPRQPCNCDIVRQKWEEDNAIVERTFTPYGSKHGAVEAWVSDRDNKVTAGGGMFPGIH